jgi:hypothetical protein
LYDKLKLSDEYGKIVGVSMDTFKLKVGLHPSYKITTKNFEDKTGNKYPYVQDQGMNKSRFAVCPACDNPIQIVGLYKNSVEGGKKPHGKHCSHSIRGIANYSLEDYDDCPFANHNRHASTKYRSEKSRLSKEILLTVREQIDRITYFLNYHTGLYISKQLASSMLDNYLKSKGWRYRNATLYNIPWIFAECNDAFPLYGKCIRKDSELYQSLSTTCPNLIFTPLNFGKKHEYVQITSSSYLALNILFCHHSRKMEDEELVESIDLWIYNQKEDGELVTVFLKNFEINQNDFVNLINKSSSQYRNQELIKMAEERIIL